MTQRELGAALGIKGPSIAQWESGRSKPEIDRLPAIAGIFGVTLETLCGEDFPPAQTSPRVELLRYFDTMNEDSKKAILQIAAQLSQIKCAA